MKELILQEDLIIEMQNDIDKEILFDLRNIQQDFLEAYEKRKSWKQLDMFINQIFE